MPVVLDATVAGATSNTYATRAEGDNYALSRPYFTTWDASTDDEKNRALVRATQLIDLYVDWDGHPTSSTQALAMPRSGLVTRDGLLVSSGVVPTRIKHAQVELAHDLLVEDITTGPSSEEGIKSVKVGSVGVEFTEASAAERGGVLSNLVWLLLSPFGRRRESTMMRRLVRA